MTILIFFFGDDLEHIPLRSPQIGSRWSDQLQKIRSGAFEGAFETVPGFQGHDDLES